MTNVALSLAALSYPGAKYHARRSPCIKKASMWARQNNHKFDLPASVEVSAYSDHSPELAALGGLLGQLDADTVAPGTVLILDDYGSLSESEMRGKALPLLLTLSQRGLVIVTLCDGKMWDEQALTDMGGFIFSVALGYADTRRSQYMSARMRASLERKAHLAQKAQEGE